MDHWDGDRDGAPARGWRARLAEGLGPLAGLPSVVADLMLIGSASLLASGLAGVADHLTPTAVGFAIYISCRHFRELRREVVALRWELAAAAYGPDGADVSAGAIGPPMAGPSHRAGRPAA